MPSEIAQHPVGCADNSWVREDDDVGEAGVSHCGSWNCEPCAEQRKRRLIAEAMSGEPQRFITLTSRRSTSVSPAQAAKRIVAAFQTVVLRWRRLKPGNTCDYLAVFEATKLGWPHLHVLWRGAYIDQRWLSAQMRELNGSPIVDVRKVSGAREAARYIAKYIGKGPGKFGTCKRYWQSRGYQLHRQDWRASAIFPGLKPRLVRGPLVEVHASWVYLGKDPSPIINERTRFGEWPPEQARPPPAWREWVT